MQTHTLIHSSASNEWYTPPKYLDAVRLVMGGIDLDPASCAEANEVVQATHFYTIKQDGLSQEWWGRVFLNPPYGRSKGESNQKIWSARLIQQYETGNVTEAILLVNAVPGCKWFRPLWNYPLCFVEGRIKFYDGKRTPKNSTHDSVFVYMGSRPLTFTEVFSQFGVIAVKSRWS